MQKWKEELRLKIQGAPYSSLFLKKLFKYLKRKIE